MVPHLYGPLRLESVRIGRRHQSGAEVRILHFAIQGKDGSHDAAVVESLEILVDATGSESHDPVRPYVVELGHQIADLVQECGVCCGVVRLATMRDMPRINLTFRQIKTADT